jgi:hypothetical protein
VQPWDIDEIETSLVKTRDDPYMVHILECKVDHVTDDLTGQVSGGYLKVKGWLRSLREFELVDVNTNVCQLVLIAKVMHLRTWILFKSIRVTSCTFTHSRIEF